MRLRTYLLFLALLALIAVSTVREKTRRIRFCYELADMLVRERWLEEDLQRCKAELTALTSPVHLERLAREMELACEPLRSAEELRRSEMAQGRRR